MSHIALIVFPDGTIKAIVNLEKPWRPPTSGYTHEERGFANSYRKQFESYNEKLKMGIVCNYEVAIKILNEQHPNRNIHSDKVEHYNVWKVTMFELCSVGTPGQLPKEVDEDSDWGGREAHFIIASSMRER